MASCTIDFCKGPCFHGFMKAEVRISINDYDGNSEEFIVESGRKSLTPTLSHGAGEGERCGGRGHHRSLSPLPSLHGREGVAAGRFSGYEWFGEVLGSWQIPRLYWARACPSSITVRIHSASAYRFGRDSLQSIG